MAKKEQTGTSDASYDLVSALYHALKGAQFALRGQADAKKQGDAELVAFFEYEQGVQKDLAERARALLSERWGVQVGGGLAMEVGGKRAAAGKQAPRPGAIGVKAPPEGAGAGVPGRGAVVHSGEESDTASHKQPPRNLEYRERDAEGHRLADKVDEAILETFPASDPPAWP